AFANGEIDVRQRLDRTAGLIELFRDAGDGELYRRIAHQLRLIGQPRHSAKPRPMIHSRSSADRKSSSSVQCVSTYRRLKVGGPRVMSLRENERRGPKASIARRSGSRRFLKG